jgi:hypothetical protein
MCRLAVVASVEFPLPPIEQFKCARGIRDFVAEIVGPAAIRVNIVKC